MKKLIIFFVFLSVSVSTYAQESDAETNNTCITVKVPNANDSKGKIRFMLYQQDNFMKSEPTDMARGFFSEGTATGTFCNITSGTYAIVCYHDVNNNVTLDLKEDGSPKEKVMTSNNSKSLTWSTAKFEVGTEEVTLEIRL